ncbi:hypothetical protein MKW98_032188, partial [Papaver atlanticum]
TGGRLTCLQDKACHYCSIRGRGLKALFLVFWNFSTALEQAKSGTRADSIKNLERTDHLLSNGPCVIWHTEKLDHPIR